MRHAIFSVFSILTLLFMFSCDQDSIDCLRVTGNGVTEMRDLDPFNRIFFNNVGNLHISQGNESKIEIRAQQVVIDKLDIRVVNGDLRISSTACFNGSDYQLDITVTTPEIVEIEMNGVGNLSTDPQITAETLTVKFSGVTNTFSMDLNVDSLTTYQSGTGIITYSGIAVKHTILFSGEGGMNAYNLSTQWADIHVTGVGDLFVSVSDYLKVELTSVGNVYYRGDPTIDKTEIGIGRVIDDN